MGQSVLPFIEESCIEAGAHDRMLVLSSAVPLFTLNSSMWGEGFGWHSLLLNRQVHRHYMCDDPLTEMTSYLLGCDIDPKQCAALMTAADLRDRGREELVTDNGLALCAWVTAGVGNAMRAGQKAEPHALYPGTINTIVILDALLSEAAMINAVITATEAKCAALQELEVRVPGGEMATGTSTDAVIIASTQRGENRIRYAGTATYIGNGLARCVYEATKRSILASAQSPSG